MMNKTVIITGVSGGIGQAIAKVFKKEGYYTIGVDVKKTEINKFIDEFYQIDVSSVKDIEYFYDEFRLKHKNINVIINNAAIQANGSFINLKEDDWDKTFKINVGSIFLLTKTFYSLLKKAKGSVVNISSVHAVATSENISAYAASKGAVLSLTRAMALEFAKDGINVNSVLPGAVNTSMLVDGLGRGHLNPGSLENKLEDLSAKHPLKRIGEPEEIANVVFFLSDKSRSGFITGQSIIADGGALARLSTE